MSTTKDLHLVFGLVASPSARGQDEAFAALSSWMQEHCGVTIERRAWPSYRELGNSVREGKSDVAWLPPVVYAWLAEGVTPLGHVSRGDTSTYSAALVSKKGSRFHALTDLRGSRAGWVDPWSAAGYVVPCIELARAKINPSTIFASEKFFGSHEEALKALARDECDVAGTYAQEKADGTFEGGWSAIENLEVQIIASFTSIPSDVIAARRNLGPKEYERAHSALHRACEDEEARGYVRTIFGGDAFRSGIAPGHAALRSAFERATAKGLFD
ncbi:MAG: PhnD/SsuA/transferrin family substrate-binding protein [Polyangiaceae bacterium]